MILNFEPESGENIQNCIKVALRTAQILQCDVEFIFNSFRVYVRPNSDAHEILKRFLSNFN